MIPTISELIKSSLDSWKKDCMNTKNINKISPIQDKNIIHK